VDPLGWSPATEWPISKEVVKSTAGTLKLQFIFEEFISFSYEGLAGHQATLTA
jgi:hypothetical protein